MDEQASGGGGGGGELNDGAEWEQVWERKYSLRKKKQRRKKKYYMRVAVSQYNSVVQGILELLYIIKIYIF